MNRDKDRVRLRVIYNRDQIHFLNYDLSLFHELSPIDPRNDNENIHSDQGDQSGPEPL